MTTNKLTDELVEDSELQMLIDSHEKGTAMFMRVDSYYLMAKELQERRKADSERKQVRSAHAEWSQATFGDVGPVGPLKHLSKEALEAAAEPGDLSEWADMQFLLWDAQRRAGISDEQINLAMVEKLVVNKQRQWPEPKDGEPRLHIKESDNSPVIPEGTTCKYCGGTGYFRWQKSANTFPCPCMGCDFPASLRQEGK